MDKGLDSGDVVRKETFKLEPDNSGGTGMIELVTGPLPFVEAKIIMAKTLKWIRENGKTNERCSIHINIAFDGKKLGPIVNMSKLFYKMFYFNENIGYWNVSNVTDMSHMFDDCTEFNQNLNKWNVSKVNNMSKMFKNCNNFNKPLNNWNVSEVKDMNWMFESCFYFTKLAKFNIYFQNF